MEDIQNLLNKDRKWFK